MTGRAMIRIKRPAMGCEFEFILCGDDRRYLIDAAEEAFEEVQRLEEQMSVFLPMSEISYINSAASTGAVRVEPRLFDLLIEARRLSPETEGAFDISIGSLVDVWSKSEQVPSQEMLDQAMAASGMSNVILNEDESTIRFARPGIRLNLGALGKAYAIRRVVRLLTERGVQSGLLSSGSSTVYALGAPPDDDAWTIGISDPTRRSERLGSVRLRNRAFSTSGSHERYVEIDGRRYSHIIDPRTGQPAKGLLAASTMTPDPVTSDALSTAFFILGPDKARMYCDSHNNVQAILIMEDEHGSTPDVVKIGIEQQSEVFNS